MDSIRNLAANSNKAWRCSELEKKERIEYFENDYRNKFMSDRDRILYFKSFLRLSGKTQVYTPTNNDDHQRTRLTHTLEVSQIARTISKALHLDCDLTEAIALGHDIGHTPFGHAGERILHEIMSPPNKQNEQIPKTTSIYKFYANKDAIGFLKGNYENEYGFKHNLQSVRCLVEDMGFRGNKFGLDLTNFTLWGIMYHSNVQYKKGKVNTDFLDPKFYEKYKCYWSHVDGNPAWSFEALIVREADEIAQMHHDLEDSIRNKVISFPKVLELVSELKDLMSDIDKTRLNELSEEVRNEKRNISKEYFIYNISHIVINTLVTKLINASKLNLEHILKENNSNTNIIFALDINESKIQNSISYDIFGENSSKEIIDNFKKKMSTFVLYTYDVQRSDSKGKYIIKNLFEAYYTNPQQLPDNSIKILYQDFQKHDNKDKEIINDMGELRLKVEQQINDYREKSDIGKDISLMRVICDYIAGMTDNFAISEYEKLYG